MVEHRIKLSSEQEQLLEREAEKLGISVGDFLKVFGTLEAERRRGNVRHRSPGRPPGGKQLRELSETLRDIYRRLQEGPWQGQEAQFKVTYKEQLEELDKLIETQDLDGLEEFYAKKPWVL